MQYACVRLSSVPLRLCSIFPHLFINSTICWTSNVCCGFRYKFCHSEENWARCDQKCILVCTWSTRCPCQILIKLEFSRQLFEKYSNIKFRDNPSSGKRVVPYRRTDRQTTKVIVTFRNFANAPKMIYLTPIHGFCRCRASYFTFVTDIYLN
jgi:hypothetical protein